MNVSVEISLYPLLDEFIGPIEAFIERLHDYSSLTVLTNTMSTQVFGEYDAVMAALNTEMQRTHRQIPQAAFALKILGSDLRPA